jgi:hypothetical protein
MLASVQPQTRAWVQAVAEARAMATDLFVTQMANSAVGNRGFPDMMRHNISILNRIIRTWQKTWHLPLESTESS